MALSSSVFPKDWSDDERMSFMFSPFPPSRASNPTHWDSKLHFWSDVITSHCRYAGRLTFTLQYLEQTFTRKKSIPACLDVVLSELHRQKKIQTKTEFCNSVTEPGWVKWTVGLVIGTTRMFTGSTVDIRGSDFVPLDVTQEKVSEIMTGVYERQFEELVMSQERLGALCKEIDSQLRDEDVGVVVCGLRREKRAVVGESEGVRVVRLAGKDEGRLGQSLTDTDKAIFNLKTTQEKLTGETERLRKEIERLRANAVEMLKMKNEEAAKTSLRRSKVLGKSLEQKESALNTIELQLEQLRSSKTNRMVVTSFSAGTTALREELNDSKLSPDKIDEVMDDIHEVLADHHDVNSALSAPISMPEDPDMEELERELNQLVVSDERASSCGATQQLDMLPAVPTTLPVLEGQSQPRLDDQQALPSGTAANRPTRDRERVAELT